jgi:hypothetical protein
MLSAMKISVSERTGHGRAAREFLEKFVARKESVIQLKKAVEERESTPSKLYGVHVVLEHEDFPVTEVRWAEPDTMSLRYVPDPGGPNAIIIGKGNKFRAGVAPGHATAFFGL